MVFPASRGALCVVLALSALILLASSTSAATLSGIVVDGQEDPATDVPVWLFRGVPPNLLDSVLLATGRTGPDGRFTFEVPDADVAQLWGEWGLSVYACRPGSALAHFGTADPGLVAWLKLEPPGTVTGRVVDAEGSPIAGVEVAPYSVADSGKRAVGRGLYAVPDELSGLFSAKTDEHGAFSVLVARRGWQVGLHAFAPGRGQAGKLGTEEGVTFRLALAGSLSGRIDCPAGADGFAGLHLEAWACDREVGSVFSATAVVDAARRFRFSDLPPGTYQVTAAEQAAADYHVGGAAGIEVASGKVTEVTLTAEKTYPVRGRVVAQDTGQGLAGVRVRLLHRAAEVPVNYWAIGTSDEGGRFELRCLPGETSLWTGFRRGYERLTTPCSVTPPDGAVLGDVVLKRVADVTGRVVDEAGEPVPGAAVLCKRGPVPAVSLPVGSSDAAGRFTLADQGPETVIVSAMKGWLFSPEVAVTPGEQEGPAVLTLSPKPAKPVTGVRVRVADQDGVPVLTARAMQIEGADGAYRARECPGADEDGTIVDTDLTDGLTYHLRLTADDCRPRVTDQWVAEDGAIKDLGTVTLQRLRGKLSGVVVDAAGGPVAGARVCVSLDAYSVRTTTTDGQGRFCLTGLVEGEVCAFVTAEGRAMAVGVAQTGEAPCRIVLEPYSAPVVGEPVPVPTAANFPRDPSATARQVLLEAVAFALRGGHTPGKGLLGALAAVDAEAAYEAAVRGRGDTAAVDLVVGRRMLAQDLEGGMSLMTRTARAEAVARELVKAADELAPGHPEAACRCLCRVLELGIHPGEPLRQLELIADVGRRLLPLNRQAGEKTLAQATEEAWRLGWEPRELVARGEVAAALCLADLEAALELVQSMPDGSPYAAVALTAMACNLAPVDLARALEMLEQIASAPQREGALPVVLSCYPTERLQEATKQARSLSVPQMRALALVRLAGRAPTDQVAALVDEAAAALESEVRRSPGRAMVLPDLYRVAIVARRLGHSGYREFGRRAAALSTRALPVVNDDWTLQQSLSFARLLAGVDPDLARHIVDGVLAEAGGAGKLQSSVAVPLLEVVASLDVSWALTVLESLPGDGSRETAAARGLAAAAVAEALTNPADEREAVLLVSDGPTGPGRGPSWLLE